MKNFRLNLIARVLLLCLTISFCTYLFLVNNIFPLAVLIFLIIIFQVYRVVKFVDRTNRELTNLLQSIQYSDFSQTFNFAGLGSSFKDLAAEFNKIMGKFKQARNEKEESLNYLQTVIQHIGVGLLSFDLNGEVGLINKAAKKILKLDHLKNISKLDELYSNFGDLLLNLPAGKKITYKLSVSQEDNYLLVYSTDYRMQGRTFRLVALQNIQAELEEKEIEAWQKLIRVLTHEIMNSVTPISSLASTVSKYLADIEDNSSINREVMEDLRSAVSTIEKRSAGLVKFVDKYRSLTKIPKPNFQNVKVSSLFSRISILMESAIQGRCSEFSTSIEPSGLEIAADAEMLEQVLINLLNNALQSIGESKQGKIFLSAQIDEQGRAVIKVADNGPGIPGGLIEKVFIPFFTTRKEGSGIGLSISQQIIRAHGGSIHVTSVPDIETVFTIKL